MWKFLVKNQSIEIIEREVLADHQIQYVQFKFTFDGDWKHFHKVVQFSQCDEVYSVVLGTDGTSCYLPAELHVGAVKMSVFGYDTASDTTVRATTVPVTLNIRASGFEGDEPPIPPTPDLYQQLLKKIEEAEAGKDGKSAYELAVQLGYVGTLDEWIASLHGKDGTTPDMSEYSKTTEIEALMKQEIAPVAEESHTHDNKAALDALTSELMAELDGLQHFKDSTAESIHTLNEALNEQHTHENKTVLDGLTAELLAELDGLQQFEDSTNFNIQTINEALLALNTQKHTHNNKAVLDSITAENVSDLNSLQQFKDSVQQDLQTVQESIESVVSQAHWHHNLTILNGITAAKVAEWDSIANLKTQLNGLSTELTVFKGKCDNNAARIGAVESDMSNTQLTLDSLQAQIDNLQLYDSSVTLFRSGADALANYGEIIYTFYNDGYRSLAGFAETYPNFCSAANDYALYYNQSDFNWGAAIYTLCTESVQVTPSKSILISYKSGAADTGEMWLVPKSSETLSPSETADYIYKAIQADTAMSVPFNWLQSPDHYCTVLISCESISAGDYYFAWKAVSDNTHPYIRNIKVLEIS